MERKKNIFDKIGSLIPGYIGYTERDSRRVCDQKIRKEIENNLLSFEKQIIRIIQRESGKKSIMELDSLRKSLETSASKIRNTTYGESSFFSDNIIANDELTKIYLFDLDIKERVNLLKTLINKKNWTKMIGDIESLRTQIEERNRFIRRFN
tara:strand:+ start:158 stop:613 length:456 start_codon:yes stop_codon:yes gene_type:complete